MRYYLRQHDIVYNTPLGGWTNGLPMGNGDLGAICYTEEKDYVLGIVKSDVWDLRYKRKKPITPHKEIMRLLKKRDWDKLKKIHEQELELQTNGNYPNPKCCGRLKLKGTVDKNNKQRLSIFNGMHTYEFGSGRVESYVHSKNNLLILRLYSRRKITLEFDRWTDKVLGRPKISHDDKYFWIDYKFPDGFQYVMVGKLNNTEYNLRKRGNSILIIPEANSDVEMYVAVVTSLESKNLFDDASKIIEDTISVGNKRSYLDHNKWWHNFWSQSFIDIDDKFIENLWYYSIYLLACSSRGKYLPTANPNFWYLSDTKPWNADYHTNANIEMLYWPIFASNHLDLGEPFYRCFYEMLPKLRKETKQVFGIDGIKYPFSATPLGHELCGGYYRYEIYVTAWIGQMFWWHYLYSQDKQFLKEMCYKVIKEILHFYEGYLSIDEKCKYFIFPCKPVEGTQTHRAESYLFWDKNVLIDLAMLKYILKAGIQASNILDMDKKDRAKWQHILKNLDEYPHNNQVFLEYEGAPVDLPIHHCDMLSPVFPCREIGIDSHKTLYDMAKNTFDSICYHTARRDACPPFPIPTWCDDLNWCWLSTVAARLGLGDTARDYLYDMGILMHLKNNGFSIIGFPENVGNPEQRLKDSLVTANPNSGLATTVNEMLLQNHNGKIRIFAAVPSDWNNCRFTNLRTEGAFLVSSQMKNRKTDWIVIESLAGGVCEVVNPWNRSKVWNIDNRSLILETDNSTIRLKTKRGGKYLISHGRFEMPRFKIPKAQRRTNPRLYLGPKYLAQVQDNRCWLVKLGN